MLRLGTSNSPDLNSFPLKLAIIRTASIYARGLAGNAADASAVQQGERVRMMAEIGWEIASSAKN